ncbi:hypothetical protein [Globicatella sp. PHS-GS-PNBC-21-1553]|uniref:hypothetical protein n=1 Tax=Globicatella sp. PHS-GS-PNBC-21-1553 TaxID=2885764 RepID=UPI00298F3C72|nr:hypothetical protein [Globicatella sp. PHS-GS-PNBC-21-1553]WPC08003.1 hypothetical protein LB888_08080 [Globicatella sp. PHS-GS-PNBC-21-1553]
MDLVNYLHKKVRMILEDGTVIEGVVRGYDTAYDSGDDYDSISIGHYFYFENQIKSIEIIED